MIRNSEYYSKPLFSGGDGALDESEVKSREI
jgi:hypothetical protein